MSTSKGHPIYSDKPRFIDQIAIDVVVSERRYMKLTPSEKRHAAHRLARYASHQEIATILRVTKRTVERLLEYPPPPILDVDEHGEKFLVAS